MSNGMGFFPLGRRAAVWIGWEISLPDAYVVCDCGDAESETRLFRCFLLVISCQISDTRQYTEPSL